MKKSACRVKKTLSTVIIFMLILCGCTGRVETVSASERGVTSPAESAGQVREFTGEKEAFAIPKGLTPDVASEYLEIVKEICSEYGPERFCWRDGDLLPHRVGFCGGLFANLDDDGVPEMILEYRAEDQNDEYESDAGEELWTWRNGNPYRSLKRQEPSSTAHGIGYDCLLKGEGRDYMKQGGILEGETSKSYFSLDENGDYCLEEENLPDESKYDEVRLSKGNTILLANSDYFLYTLAGAAAEADGSDPMMILAEMGYAVDPSSMRGETEEYDPAAAAVGKNGEADWYGILRSLYDNNPQAFADTSKLTATVHSDQDMGWYTRDGILGAELLDMTGDGKDDLVLYRIRSSKDGIPHEDLYMSIYTCKDGKIIGSWETRVNEDAMVPFTGVSYDSIRVGSVKLDGSPYIWTEYAHNSHYANGSTFVVTLFGYDEYDGECSLRRYWLNGKTTAGTNGVVFSLQTFGHDSDGMEPDSDELLWTDNYGNGDQGPCADPSAAVAEGYKRIGFPDTAVYGGDPSTETGAGGDEFRDQFPTYWNTTVVKKTVQLIESGTGPNDNREMTSRINDFTKAESSIRKHDSVFSEYIEFLSALASGDPEKVTAGGAGQKSSSSGGETGKAGKTGKSGENAGQKTGKTEKSAGQKTGNTDKASGKNTGKTDKASGKNTGKTDKDVREKSGGPEKVASGTTGIKGVNVSGEKGILSAEARPGDTVTLGSYAASADGTESPVEWTVLENRDGYALLISRYAVDCLPYHDSWDDMTWEKCSLRTWLNVDFLEETFSPEERKCIVSSTVVNRDNSGNPAGAVTNDQVFILDIDELEQYFDSDEDRRAGATDYAQSQGAYVDEKRDACWYWVRNPGDSPRYAVYVNCLGDILERGSLVFGNTFGVRPAIRVRTY